MSDVVLRCPNCGTTQGAPGECESCHDASVRFYCPNHAPGLWLDAPVCPDCGARVAGERGAREEADRARVARGPRAGRMPGGRAARPSPPADASARHGSVPPRTASPEAPVTLEELLDKRAASARGAWGRVGAPHMRLPTFPLLGCLGRLLALGVLALFVLAMGTCWFLGGTVSMRDWIVDLGQQTGLVAGVPAQARRGIAAFEAGDRATAEREFAEAARLYPRSALALVYLARIRREAGDDYRAREYLRAAIAREPDDAAAYRELGALHLARAQRARAVRADPLDVTEELEIADQQYARAVQLDPADRSARGFHGCVLVQLGREPEAAEARAVAGPGPWDECARAPLR